MASAELQKVIEQYKMLARNAAQAKGPQELRAALAKTFSGFPSAGKVTCEDLSINGVRAQWIAAPDAAVDRTILYLHGGGYVMGSIETHRELVARLSKAAMARCLALDYRLAPENPFPAAVNDATAAYRWLLAQGIKPGRIAIAGDSAGGGLTLATLVALRDLGLPTPAAAVCISPWIDLEGTGASMRTKAAADPVVSREMIVALAKLYVGEQGDLHDPLAAPLYADFTGLPPLLVQVGNAETLLDDSTRVAERAEAAGVEVVLQIWDEMPHVWQWFAPILPEGQEAIDQIGDFVLKRTT
ncbi:MAG TPA: alpha/beta hydrolase [Candidatus Binataceae bacterium]|nr:alpha/beta hydrolase [Candidatus Binataceae bacterium]